MNAWMSDFDRRYSDDPDWQQMRHRLTTDDPGLKSLHYHIAARLLRKIDGENEQLRARIAELETEATMSDDIKQAIATLAEYLDRNNSNNARGHEYQSNAEKALYLVEQRIAELEQQPEKKLLHIWFTRSSAQKMLERLIDSCIESPDGFWLDLAVQRTKQPTTDSESV